MQNDKEELAARRFLNFVYRVHNDIAAVTILTENEYRNHQRVCDAIFYR